MTIVARIVLGVFNISAWITTIVRSMVLLLIRQAVINDSRNSGVFRRRIRR